MNFSINELTPLEINYPDGTSFKGFTKDGIIEYAGRLIGSDGCEIYSGDYLHGEKSGTGTYVFPDGSVYKGQWKNDSRNGKGLMKYPDGSTYFGDWKDGKKHGHAKVTDSDGTAHEGEWVNGVEVHKHYSNGGENHE